jgi:hypothetical protein
VRLIRYTRESILIDAVAMNHVLAPPLLLQGSDDEIASAATDVSDDGENDMWVFSQIILTLMIYWNLSISDSVKYLITLQKIRSKCEAAKGNPI